MNECVTRHLNIYGRVQGVGFRNYLEFKAHQLSVYGWVRNRSDGSVEAMVSGLPAAIEAIIECAKRGPRTAQVTAVEISEVAGQYTAFTVKPTE